MAHPPIDPANPKPATGAAGPANPAAKPGPGRPAGPKSAARPGARTLPAAQPGPKIQRAAGQGVAGTDPPPIAGKPAIAAPASPGAGVKSPSRSTPKRLQDFHATAAKRLGIPELAISGEEASELQETIDAMGQLTGYTPSGPFWVWAGVFWTLLSIYGGRLIDIRARTAREAAPAPAPAPARKPDPPGPFDPSSPLNIQNLAPAPVASVPPAPVIRPAATRAPTPARDSASVTNGAAGPPLDAKGFADFLANGGPEGLTPDIPGVPRTTLEERSGGL